MLQERLVLKNYHYCIYNANAAATATTTSDATDIVAMAKAPLLQVLTELVVI